MSVLRLFFSFQGRINRLQYWTGGLVVAVLALGALVTIGFNAGERLQFAKDGAQAMQVLGGAAMLLAPILMVTAWCGQALQVKRLHDRGRSGFLALLPIALGAGVTMTFVNGAVTGADPMQVLAQANVLGLLSTLVNLVFLIDLGFMPSKEGPSKYGPAPGGGAAASTPPKAAPAAPAPNLGNAAVAMERAINQRDIAPAIAARPPQRTPPDASSLPAQSAPAAFGRRASR